MVVVAVVVKEAVAVIVINRRFHLKKGPDGPFLLQKYCFFHAHKFSIMAVVNMDEFAMNGRVDTTWYDASWVIRAIAVRLYRQNLSQDGVHVKLIDLLAGSSNSVEAVVNSITNDHSAKGIFVLPIRQSNHFTTLVLDLRSTQFKAYYRDSFGRPIPDNISEVLKNSFSGVQIVNLSEAVQDNVYDCGIYATDAAVKMVVALKQDRVPSTSADFTQPLDVKEARIRDYEAVTEDLEGSQPCGVDFSVTVDKPPEVSFTASARQAITASKSETDVSNVVAYETANKRIEYVTREEQINKDEVLAKQLHEKLNGSTDAFAVYRQIMSSNSSSTCAAEARNIDGNAGQAQPLLVQ